MTHILSRANLPALRRASKGRVLLAFDFDGTLAPIVSDRDAARMRRRTRALLERVCRLFPCVVISGRSHADVSARLEGLPFRHVVGNHGLAPGAATGALARRAARARAAVAAALGRQPGVDVEDKTCAFAVHYRAAPDRRRARRRIEAALSVIGAGFRVIPGKMVFDVVPSAVPHKGDALLRLLRRTRSQAAIYVGDDVTDEDVFALGAPARVTSIRVGRSPRSAADYFLRDQRELDLLLDHLGTARESGRDSPGAVARGGSPPRRRGVPAARRAGFEA